MHGCILAVLVSASAGTVGAVGQDTDATVQVKQVNRTHTFIPPADALVPADGHARQLRCDTGEATVIGAGHFILEEPEDDQGCAEVALDLNNLRPVDRITIRFDVDIHITGGSRGEYGIVWWLGPSAGGFGENGTHTHDVVIDGDRETLHAAWSLIESQPESCPLSEWGESECFDGSGSDSDGEARVTVSNITFTSFSEVPILEEYGTLRNGAHPDGETPGSYSWVEQGTRIGVPPGWMDTAGWGSMELTIDYSEGVRASFRTPDGTPVEPSKALANHPDEPHRYILQEGELLEHGAGNYTIFYRTPPVRSQDVLPSGSLALWFADRTPVQQISLGVLAAVLPALVGSLGFRGVSVIRRRAKTMRGLAIGYTCTGASFAGLVGAFAWLTLRHEGLARAMSWPLDTGGITLYVVYVLWWTTAFIFLGQGITLRARERRAELTDTQGQNDQLRRRAAELETYTQGLTHDLKTPLIALDWLTKDLESEIQDTDTEALDGTLTRIRKNVGGMDRMVKDLLEMSAVENEGIAGRERVDGRLVAQDVVDELEDTIRRAGATVQVHQDALPVVLGDPGRLHQALRNLVGNAVKYGGDLVQVHGRRLGRPGAEEGYELFVDDDGPGVPPDMRERVFELFDRGAADKETEGTGLGLALVKRIVEAHEGAIRVEDAPGGGARFVVALPVDRIVRRP